MKSKIGWILAILFGLVILFFLPSLFLGRFGGGGYGGMMGPGMMGVFSYMNPFGFFGMALMWLIPIGLVVLLVVGAVALLNGLTQSRNPTLPVSSGRNCPNCGRPAQSDWVICPYCGKSLQG